jgi:YD repeat-containing protein
VSYLSLHDALRSGLTIKTRRQLFPDSYTTSYQWPNTSYPFIDIRPDDNYDPKVPAIVWLPDGRRYKLKYNEYGELARVELPTGGAFEYDWGPNTGNGKFDIFETGENTQVRRRLTERRVYSDGTTLDSKTVFGGLQATDSYDPYDRTGSVLEDHYDQGGTRLIERIKHYYHGITGPQDSAFWLYEQNNHRRRSIRTMGQLSRDRQLTTGLRVRPAGGVRILLNSLRLTIRSWIR